MQHLVHVRLTVWTSDRLNQCTAQLRHRSPSYFSTDNNHTSYRHWSFSCLYQWWPYPLLISIIQQTPKTTTHLLNFTNNDDSVTYDKLSYCYLAFVLFIVLWQSITHTLSNPKIICGVDVLISSATCKKTQAHLKMLSTKCVHKS